MKQRDTQLVRTDSHVLLHLFTIFQLDARHAEAGIKEGDEEAARSRGRPETQGESWPGVQGRPRPSTRKETRVLPGKCSLGVFRSLYVALGLGDP